MHIRRLTRRTLLIVFPLLFALVFALVGAKRRALTGVLPLGSRTEAASEKGQRGLTLDYT